LNPAGILHTNFSSEIKIIGPRACGKTSYLAVLTDWHQLMRKEVITLVEPIGEDAQILMNKARNILDQGLGLEPTHFWYDRDLPSYLFLIEVKPSFWLHPIDWIFRRKIRVNLNLQDYPGEFVSDLAGVNSDSGLTAYLDSCAISSGLLFMVNITSQSSRGDREHAAAVQNLQREISFRLRRGRRKRAEYRIAFVISKIDQPNLYPHRTQPERLLAKNLPRTSNAMKEWRRAGYQVAYFACSAFGVYGDPAQPNAIKISEGIFLIDNPSVLKPVGLYAPVYWLCTGKNDRRLRRI
jgi:hypothetical protein